MPGELTEVTEGVADRLPSLLTHVCIRSLRRKGPDVKSGTTSLALTLLCRGDGGREDQVADTGTGEEGDARSNTAIRLWGPVRAARCGTAIGAGRLAARRDDSGVERAGRGETPAPAAGVPSGVTNPLRPGEAVGGEFENAITEAPTP